MLNNKNIRSPHPLRNLIPVLHDLYIQAHIRDYSGCRFKLVVLSSSQIVLRFEAVIVNREGNALEANELCYECRQTVKLLMETAICGAI